MKLQSKKRIFAEIAKCEILCANCHCKEHYKEDSVGSHEIAGVASRSAKPMC